MHFGERLALIVGLAAIVGAAHTVESRADARRKPPAERMLAGYALDKPGSVNLRDARTGYYLVRARECDGAHMYLGLYPNRAALAEVAGSSDSPIAAGRLRDLRTGHGVAIGDTAAEVLGKMGSPTWQGLARHTAGERVWSYHHLSGTHAKGVEYITLFRFRHGHVTGIELDREAYPG